MLNRVTIIGNLGNDPTINYLPNANAVANITVATTMRWKDKQTGERVEAVEWHRVTMYNKLAEIAGQYLKKGQQVYIEGRLQTRKWQGQDGQDRYTTEIIASVMNMLGSKCQEPSNNAAGAPKTMQEAHEVASRNMPLQAPPIDYDDYNDDIPF